VSEQKVADAVNAFSLAMSRQVPSNVNLVFSPASLVTALGMASLGARGETLAAFRKVIDLPEVDADAFHAALGAAVPPSEAFTLKAANRLFAQRGYAFVDAFRAALTRHYRGGFNEVDFKTDPARVRSTINAWVAHETEKKIPELLPLGLPTVEDRLVLVNAAYFKALWFRPFPREATLPETFHLTPQRDVTVPFMHVVGGFEYSRDEVGQYVVLPYRSRRQEAVVFLPDRFDSLPTLVPSVSELNVHVQLPRFEVSWGKDLAPDLVQLGLGPACGNDADFSGMANAPGEPIRLGGVIHKALCRFDEEGTVAAAATAMAFRAGAARRPPIDFRVDRPFWFWVRDSRTKLVRFLGHVVDPTP
jgi:serpin B